jgi:hypothetical protein
LGQAFTLVEAYITNGSINLPDIPALIEILETASGNPDYLATAEHKWEVLK